MRNKIIFFSLFMSNLNYILYNSIGINDNIKNGIRIGVVGLLLVTILYKIAENKFRKEEILWVLLLIVSMVSLNINRNIVNFFYIILFVFVTKNIEKGKLVKWSYYIMLISLLLVAFMLLAGIISNLHYSIGERARYTFGFLNVNSFSSLIYSFFIIFSMYNKKNNKILTVLLVSLMFLIFKLTDTRTMFFAFIIYVFFYVLLSIVFKYNKINATAIKVSLIILLFIPILFSFASPILLQYFPNLDILTSYRLTVFSDYIYSQQPINFLLGGTSVNDIDNGFLTIFFNAGILFSIYMIYLIIKSINNSVENTDYKTIAFIISFVYFNAFESLMLRPEISVSILFWIVVFTSLDSKAYTFREMGENIKGFKIPY